MTHEEIDILWQKAMQESIKNGEMFTRYHFAKLVAEKALAQEKALQALHSENERLGLYKDAYAEPEPEPVAWRDVIAVNLVREGINKHRARELAEHFIKLTTPPQRTWVGLTEQEHTDIAVECGCLSADWVFYGAAVERKVKERNT